MIEVNNLAKYYGDFIAVRDVTFSAEKGDVLGFLGPNGAGKTTTLRMLATYLPPTSGSAKIAGYDINLQSDDVRRSIGYLPETPPLYPEMTVVEYLNFVAQIKGVKKRDLKNKIELAIERCFLGEVRQKLCGQLSKGFKQRVGIAQAIVHNPPVLIFDEPTSGLDPKQIIEIRQLISSLAQDHTILISTHILPEVNSVCNRVVIIDRGEVVLESSLAEATRSRSLEQVFLECVSRQEDKRTKPLSAVGS